MPRSSEAGFSVIELLVVTLIGGVVFMTLATMLDATQRSSSRITARVESTQRGRIAMEQITQSLRSHVCIGDKRPIVEGSDGNRVVFYSARPTRVAGQGKPTDFAPEKRELSYASNQIVESVTPGTGTYPETSFDGTPRRRVLVGDVLPAKSGLPVFTYYTLNANGTVSSAPLAVPLSADDAASVARIDIAYAARPSIGSKLAGTHAGFESSVSVRLPARTDVDNIRRPACLI